MICTRRPRRDKLWPDEDRARDDFMRRGDCERHSGHPALAAGALAKNLEEVAARGCAFDRVTKPPTQGPALVSPSPRASRRRYLESRRPSGRGSEALLSLFFPPRD